VDRALARAIAPGGVSAQHCMTMDWSATMLDAAARGRSAYPLDGVSLLPVLRDPAHASRARCTGA
jgi:hypothetical protein